jgi:hypothetical protein
MLICVYIMHVFQVICSLIFNLRSILDLFLGSVYFKNWFEYIEDEMVQVDCLWNPLWGIKICVRNSEIELNLAEIAYVIQWDLC